MATALNPLIGYDAAAKIAKTSFSTGRTVRELSYESSGLTREQVINDVLLAKQPTKQFVQPAQVAALAVFLCRDEAAQVTGANLSMDGGWTAA